MKSPNPAFANVDVPLVSTFMLSAKPGNEAYVEPVIEGDGYRFTVKVGEPHEPEAAKAGTKLGRGSNFRCVMSGTPVSGDYIKAEGKAGRLDARLMAVVVEGDRGRLYLGPTPEHEAAPRLAQPAWKPEGDVPAHLTGGTCVPYGLDQWGKLFTPRQLVALTTFSDLVIEARDRVRRDARDAALADDDVPLRDDGLGALAYAEAVAVYLGLTVSRSTDRHNTLCSWDMGPSTTRSSTGSPARSASIRNAFSRQALPMTWDFAEGNPFSESAANIVDSANWIAKVLDRLSPASSGKALQADASQGNQRIAAVTSTDPPYYDNIGYADLSDFFYVWVRRTLRSVFPDLFGTVAVPKSEELVATPYRHGGRDNAEAFFLGGMTEAMRRLAEQSHPAFPVTIYYAFKQSETASTEGTASTGWETFLAAVIKAGFGLTGTWPIRTELSNRMIGSGTNALASSVVLVCRPRAVGARSATRRQFQAALRSELPAALAHLQRSNIAPVDLAQAAIGPGMGVFTRYGDVLNADGTQMAVREALTLINQTLDEVLTEQEGDFDADSRWAVTWSEQFGYAEGDYGVAEQLSKSKNTSVAGMQDAGILTSSRGKVRLRKPSELAADWDPATDPRLTVWEMTHHFIRALESGGETAAAALVAKLGTKAEVARELAYRLYTVSERKKRATDALAYNGLVQSWPEIVRLAREEVASEGGVSQGALALDQP